MFGQYGEQSEPLVLLERAKNGDGRAREDLIAGHRPFIARCVAQAAPVRGEVTATDAYSVALLAFNEAVGRYDAGRGASFHGFARQVIRRRLADYHRAARRHAAEVPHAEPVPETAGRPETAAAFPVEEAREELLRLAALLADFGISFEDLVRETPKHRDSRRIAVGIAFRIVEDPGMLASLKRKKKLPFARLVRAVVFNPKTVQRHRKYIIAVCLILSGDFPILRDYVRGVWEGGVQDGEGR